nr:pyridoxamine 5'-phosphate oxidase family protein [Achromobacter xylosoxidans]
MAHIDAAAWEQLAAAADRPEAGFRYVSLCSVDAASRPQSRMVVLRRVDVAKRLLEIHTDVRSAKWRELSTNPQATALGFCTQARLQLRLQGLTELHAPGSERAERAWQTLSSWTRQTYAGGPPGDELAFDAAREAVPPAAAHEADGKAYFGVVTFRAEALDWFQLQRQNNRRACFAYGADGALAGSQWVNP